MKLSKLRELIKNLPDDADIDLLVPGPDHSYRIASIRQVKAAFVTGKTRQSNYIGEWYGNSADYELTDGEKLEVKLALLVS